MKTQFIVQTPGGSKYTDLFLEALKEGPFKRLRCAVAYATVGGVHALDTAMRADPQNRWQAIEKQWLVGIDWCRSDPAALDRLAAMPASTIRIPEGASLIDSPSCTPTYTYHPKLFIFSQQDSAAIICGSGNLSANGLLRGCECGGVSMALRNGGEDALAEAQKLEEWFDSAWSKATEYALIQAEYRKLCHERALTRAATPTDDDVRPPIQPGQRSRALSQEQIHQLRTFDHFWIEAGALGANLGRGIPGNQLDMKRFSRVFFGASLANVQPNKIIDHVTLIWGGERFADRTLKFGDNSMDKLNVPPVGHRGATFYRGKTLLFTRRTDGEFDFEVGTARNLRLWKARSETRGFSDMVGRRQWGAF